MDDERNMFGGEFTEAEVNALARFAGTTEVWKTGPRRYVAVAWLGEGDKRLMFVGCDGPTKKAAVTAMQHELARKLIEEEAKAKPITWLVRFRGPAMEARDVRAGEKPYDECSHEFTAPTEERARELAQAWADEIGEGLEIFDVEETFPV